MRDEQWILEPMGRSNPPKLSDPELYHLDGVPWFEAPLPRRLHRCRAQTRGYIGFHLVERCACGSIRRDGRGWWMERNRDRSRRDVPAESYIERRQREIDQWSETMASIEAKGHLGLDRDLPTEGREDIEQTTQDDGCPRCGRRVAHRHILWEAGEKNGRSYDSQTDPAFDPDRAYEIDSDRVL